MEKNTGPLSVIVEQQRSDLLTLLTRTVGNDGSVILFVEQHLYCAFKYLGFLKDGALPVKSLMGIYPIREAVDYLPAQNVVYLVSPNLEMIRPLVVHLLSYTQRFPKAAPLIVFAPQKPLMVEQIITQDFKLTQTFPDLRLLEYDFDIVAFEEDVFSMEQPMTFKHLFVDGDITALRWIARLLMKLQASCFGAVSTIRAKGFKAAKVVQLLGQMQREVGADFMTDMPSDVENLFIFDRTLDMVTPLMTQLTYEGLIDELYGIAGGEGVFPFSFGESSKPGMDQRTVLSSQDKVFGELRDRNISSVGAALYQKAGWVKQNYERRKEVQQLKELKEFMQGLPEMQEIHRLVGLHTTIATDIGKRTQTSSFRRRIATEQSIIQQINDKDVLEFIDEQINRKEPLPSVMRLICLYAVVNGGLKPKDFDAIRESMMLTYGIPQVINAFAVLEAGGLLGKADTKSNYAAIRKHCRTWHTSLNEEKPNDIAYTYSGYAPLLVRLVEVMLANPESWASSDSIVNLLPGEKAELRNSVEVAGPGRATLVFVIGGVTSAEISSLRFVQEQLLKSGRQHRLLVASTDITCGNRFINGILPFDATS